MVEDVSADAIKSKGMGLGLGQDWIQLFRSCHQESASLSPQLLSPALLSFMALQQVEEGPRRSRLTIGKGDNFMRVYRNPPPFFAFYLFYWIYWVAFVPKLYRFQVYNSIQPHLPAWESAKSTRACRTLPRTTHCVWRWRQPQFRDDWHLAHTGKRDILERKEGAGFFVRGKSTA